MTAIGDDPQVIQNMPIETPQGWSQPREHIDQEPLMGLAQTIKETGILQPLLVRREGSEFIVVEGHRRLMAAKMASLTHVPVIIDDRELSDAEVVYRQLVTNCSREELKPLEKARAIDRLMKAAQWSASQIAVKLGMSASTVSKLLALLSLPEQVQEQVASGALPPTTAYELSHAESEQQAQLATQAANGGLTREDVVQRARPRRNSRRSPANRAPKGKGQKRVNIPLGGNRSVTVAGPELSLSSIIDWLADLVERLRGAQERNAELADAVSMASNA